MYNVTRRKFGYPLKLGYLTAFYVDKLLSVPKFKASLEHRNNSAIK